MPPGSRAPWGRGLATAARLGREKLRGLLRGGQLVLVEQEPASAGDAEDIGDCPLGRSLGHEERDAEREIARLEDEVRGRVHRGVSRWAGRAEHPRRATGKVARRGVRVPRA